MKWVPLVGCVWCASMAALLWHHGSVVYGGWVVAAVWAFDSFMRAVVVDAQKPK
jgi:hypothetical protein